MIDMPVPEHPKIYHILHLDRLNSVIKKGLLSDAQILKHSIPGTTIGINNIKKRRLNELKLNSYSNPDLYVGQCVPFYFCPRSIMLYLLHKANHTDLPYRGGQESILHLEADLYTVIKWAEQHHHRWAFTSSNAGSYYFQDYCQRTQLIMLNWEAIQARQWNSEEIKEAKQAEFLIESCFPWHLVERIGVYSKSIYQEVINKLPLSGYRPPVEVKPEWYY